MEDVSQQDMEEVICVVEYEGSDRVGQRVINIKGYGDIVEYGGSKPIGY